MLDWLYPFPPTMVYHRPNDLLKIEEYHLFHISNDGTIAYYKFVA